MPKLKSNSPELQSKHFPKPGASKNLADTKEGPYYVKWTAQSHEWYGDDHPETGKGRYKQKGNGGAIIARDISSYAHARKIADTLDKRYKEGKFHDKSVYAKMGKDWYINDYHGASVESHADAKENDDIDQWELDDAERWAKASGKRNRPTSFAKYVKESCANKLLETKKTFDPAEYDADDFSQPMKDPVRIGLNGIIERQAAKLKYGVFDSKHSKKAALKTAFKERMNADPHFKSGE